MRPALLRITPILVASSHPALCFGAPAVTKPVGVSSADLAQWSLGLAVTVIMILCCAWFLRRVNQVAIGGSVKMKLLGGVSVGTRERVVLLQVGRERLLLGVAPGRVQTLHIMDPAEEPGAEEETAPGGFRSTLQQISGNIK